MCLGFLFIFIPVIASYLFYITDHPALMFIAFIATFGCFCSLGIMYNYKSHSGTQSVPDSITLVNMVFSILGLLLLAISIILLFF